MWGERLGPFHCRSNTRRDDCGVLGPAGGECHAWVLQADIESSQALVGQRFGLALIRESEEEAFAFFAKGDIIRHDTWAWFLLFSLWVCDMMGSIR